MSCQVSSQTCAMACAGMASPKHASPPDGLTGIRPPIVVAPLRSRLLGLALGAQPEVLVPVQLQRGRQVVHLGQAQVLGPDTGLGVGGVEDLVLEHPLRARPPLRWNPLRYPAIRADAAGSAASQADTARTDGTPSSEPRCFSANALLATISAAAPSDVAQMSSSRSGSDTTGLASTSSTELSLRYRAFGLSRPCRGVLDLHRAKSSSVAP